MSQANDLLLSSLRNIENHAGDVVEALKDSDYTEAAYRAEIVLRLVRGMIEAHAAPDPREFTAGEMADFRRLVREGKRPTVIATVRARLGLGLKEAFHWTETNCR